MLFNKTANWKKYLSKKDEDSLNKFLEKTSKHRPAYKNAEEVKIAQLWCAALELKKQNEKLSARVKRLENVLNSMTTTDERERQDLMKKLKEF